MNRCNNLERIKSSSRSFSKSLSRVAATANLPSRAKEKNMNSSSASDTETTVRGCENLLPKGSLDHTTPEAYDCLVVLIVISITASPITTALNALIIIAVKGNHRLKNKSNIALACLSTTDLVMGLIGQPAFVSWMIAHLQRNNTSAFSYCIRAFSSTIPLRVLGNASLSHLAMINVERYIAIKHSLRYETIVTENRLVGLSALLWMIAIPLTVPSTFAADKNIFSVINVINISLCLATIFFSQVVLYYEISRHEKQIASQQVSLEAREKFLKGKKAFKLTATVFFFLILSYLPLMLVNLLRLTPVRFSVNINYIILHTSLTAVVLNSMINPIIYCVRIRQFRVAFIKDLFRKSSAEAENLEKRVFARLNHPHQDVSFD